MQFALWKKNNKTVKADNEIRDIQIKILYCSVKEQQFLILIKLNFPRKNLCYNSNVSKILQVFSDYLGGYYYYCNYF